MRGKGERRKLAARQPCAKHSEGLGHTGHRAEQGELNPTRATKEKKVIRCRDVHTNDGDGVDEVGNEGT